MKIGKTEKHVANLYYEKEFVVHIKKLKQTLNHELVLKKKCTESVHSVKELD